MSTQSKKMILCLIICIVLIIPSTICVNAKEKFYVRFMRGRLRNQQFEQYAEIDYNSSFINSSLGLEQSLNLPIKIKYWTSVPDSLWSKGVWGFGILGIIRKISFITANEIVFGRGMPQQYIKLNITSKPDWIECKFTKDSFPIDFITFDDSKNDRGSFFLPNTTGNPGYVKDFPDKKKSIFNTSLIISPLIEAPAKKYSIGIELFLKSQGMIKEAVFYKNITFTPSFFPKIDFKVKDPIKFKTPKESVNFAINVTNYANKKIRIYPKLNMKSHSPYEINPKYIFLYPNESSTFYFSQISKEKLGWYDTIKNYYINFYVELPPFSDNISYGPYPIKLSLNTYGMSTPSFHVFLILFSFILLIIQKKRNREL